MAGYAGLEFRRELEAGRKQRSQRHHKTIRLKQDLMTGDGEREASLRVIHLPIWGSVRTVGQQMEPRTHER